MNPTFKNNVIDLFPQQKPALEFPDIAGNNSSIPFLPTYPLIQPFPDMFIESKWLIAFSILLHIIQATFRESTSLPFGVRDATLSHKIGSVGALYPNVQDAALF